MHQVRLFARRREALDELVDWAARTLPELRLEATTDKRAAVDGAGAVVSGLTIGLRGAELEPGWLADDALLLPLDYASSMGAGLARGATVVADDVEQFAAVAPVKLSADYPSARHWTGELLTGEVARPAGRLVCQNLGIGITDLVFAAHVAGQAEDLGIGIELPA